MLEDVPVERHVESIGGAEQQMKPNDVVAPIPEPMAGQEQQHHQNRIEGEEIRRERNDEVALVHDDMAPGVGSFELLHFSAEQPGPQDVGQLMAEDIYPQ